MLEKVRLLVELMVERCMGRRGGTIASGTNQIVFIVDRHFYSMHTIPVRVEDECLVHVLGVSPGVAQTWNA